MDDLDSMLADIQQSTSQSRRTSVKPTSAKKYEAAQLIDVDQELENLGLTANKAEVFEMPSKPKSPTSVSPVRRKKKKDFLFEFIFRFCFLSFVNFFCFDILKVLDIEN